MRSPTKLFLRLENALVYNIDMKMTYRFRIKDSTSKKQLDLWSNAVNYVWNYCKDTSTKAWRRNRRCLSGYDLNYLTSGSSKELGLPAQTIQAIGEQFARSAKQHHKIPRWRSHLKDLGWVPWKSTSFRMNDNIITFNGKQLNIWKSRPLGGPVKTGSFSKDTLGRWYVNIICEVAKQPVAPKETRVGLDLGMKTHITSSVGTKYTRPNITKQYEEQLAMAQRARHKRKVAKIYQHIKDKRKDWIHKTTTKIIKQYYTIVVGGVSTNNVIKPKAKGFNKSLYDASWFQLKTALKYKAQTLGGEYVEINEAYTTQSCSACGARTGPKGTEGLSVREWKCSNCWSFHDRDQNAAQNILIRGIKKGNKGANAPRLGHQSPAWRP